MEQMTGKGSASVSVASVSVVGAAGETGARETAAGEAEACETGDRNMWCVIWYSCSIYACGSGVTSGRGIVWYCVRGLCKIPHGFYRILTYDREKTNPAQF